MKKIKLPGDNFSLKTKKTEDPQIMQWINTQTNLMDSLRYLMENEIRLHGVRNLQAIVPMERNALGSGTSGVEANYEAAAAREPERPAEEEIDDEDIEAWI